MMPQKIAKPIIPKPEKTATSDDLVEALVHGNPVETAAVLRRLEALERPELCVLADLLDGASAFPYKLRFVRRRRGKPSADYLQKQAEDFAIKRRFQIAFDKWGKYEAAVHEVVEQTKFSRTRVTGAVAAKKNTETAESD
jgi:hypothetical protein